MHHFDFFNLALWWTFLFWSHSFNSPTKYSVREISGESSSAKDYIFLTPEVSWHAGRKDPNADDLNKKLTFIEVKQITPGGNTEGVKPKT